MFPETNDPPPRAPPSGRSGGWRRGQQTVAHIGRAHSQHRWQRHPPPSQHSSDLDDRRRVARRWRMMPPARPPPPGQPAGATAMVRRWRRRRPAAQACPRLAPAPPLTPPSAARPPSTSHPRHQSSQLPSAGGPHHIRCTPTPLSGARFTRGAVCRAGRRREAADVSAAPQPRRQPKRAGASPGGGAPARWGAHTTSGEQEKDGAGVWRAAARRAHCPPHHPRRRGWRGVRRKRAAAMPAAHPSVGAIAAASADRRWGWGRR